jgi:hypothetical protein
MLKRSTALAALIAAALTVWVFAQPERQWLAGDSHIHSHWSASYDRTATPPNPIKGGEGSYPTPINAKKAREYGLSWMVTTDHGGPNHAKYNRDFAYEELKAARRLVPEVLQFYGMELNMPAMDHHTLIIPHTAEEWRTLFDIESRFDSSEAWPADPARNTEAAAAQALTYMKSLPRLPLMFANHPARSASGIGQYGRDEPREFRAYNDLAPDVYHGMEGAPGHQAGGLGRDGLPKRNAQGQPTGSRGSYGNEQARTFGGFDQMTAIVGGLWDSLLGEGRRFWIVATSDSHRHYADPDRSGSDFWPGEYQKTYVYARKNFGDILDGLRAGRIFAVAGDLVSELDVRAAAAGNSAEIGGTLLAPLGSEVKVTLRFRDSDTPNARGDNPKLRRIDLIAGRVLGPVRARGLDHNVDRNDTTAVIARFTEKDWTLQNGLAIVNTVLPKLEGNIYVRVRGTNTDDLEPPMDGPGEDPWKDLWVYSNPIFVEVASQSQSQSAAIIR